MVSTRTYVFPIFNNIWTSSRISTNLGTNINQVQKTPTLHLQFPALSNIKMWSTVVERRLTHGNTAEKKNILNLNWGKFSYDNNKHL
jgi:hypothetical protein